MDEDCQTIQGGARRNGASVQQVAIHQHNNNQIDAKGAHHCRVEKVLFDTSTSNDHHKGKAYRRCQGSHQGGNAKRSVQETAAVHFAGESVGRRVGSVHASYIEIKGPSLQDSELLQWIRIMHAY